MERERERERERRKRKALLEYAAVSSHSVVKIQPFSPVFPLVKPMAKAFFWLFL